jgi:hypothetical protein
MTRPDAACAEPGRADPDASWQPEPRRGLACLDSTADSLDWISATDGRLWVSGGSCLSSALPLAV